MEWINDIRGQTIGLDTAPLIYFIEENPISVALNSGASHFLTNDVRLPGIPSIKILTLDELI